MAYKAVFINKGPIIMHANPYHWPAGSPVGGQFAPAPHGTYGHAAAIYTVTGSSSSSTGSSASNSGGSTSTGSSSSYSGGGSSSTTPPSQSQTNTGPVNYKRGNPLLLTNDQLRERNTRAQLINNYNKNYPSTAQQFQEFAGKANQLVGDGAKFVKTFVKEPNYTPLDLSAYSSEELRAHVNRAQLEQQFNNYYNPPKEDHTKEFIDRAAQGLGLAISAAGVAVPIIIAAVQSKKGG